MVRLSLLKKPPSLFRETVPQKGNLRVMFEAVETPNLFLVEWYVALPTMLLGSEARMTVMWGMDRLLKRTV